LIMSDVCAACGHEGAHNKKCARCRMVSYCSKECQTSHWRSAHKAECKKGCVLEYSGTVNDGGGEKVQYKFKKILTSRTTVRALADGNMTQAKIDMMQDIIDEFADAKWNLRDEWTCRCGAIATRLVSLPACHCLLAVPGEKTPSFMSLIETIASATCELHVNKAMKEQQLLGQMMLRSMQDGDLADPNLIVNGQAPRGGRPRP